MSSEPLFTPEFVDFIVGLARERAEANPHRHDRDDPVLAAARKVAYWAQRQEYDAKVAQR